MKQLEEAEIRKLKEGVVKYLINHPKATSRETEKAGFHSGMRAFGGVNNVRKAAGVEPRFVRLSKAERKQRFLGYLREHPETTVCDIRRHSEGSLYVDFMVCYGQEGHGINKARKEAGIKNEFERIKREQKRGKKQKCETRILAYLKQNPDATLCDLVEAGLGNDLRIAYGNKIRQARRELGLRQRPLRENTLYADIWDDNIGLRHDSRPGTSLREAIRPLLTEREFGIVIRYYGLGQQSQTLGKIGRTHGVTGERIRQTIAYNILPKLSYLNNQKVIANACLPYAADERTRNFLAGIPEYSPDNFLPYRIDQMYFPDGCTPIKALTKAGIVTIGQFLVAENQGLKTKALGLTKRRYVLDELNKFGIKPVYK